MAFTFSLPGQVFIGSDCLRKTEAALKELGEKAFIVTGKVVTKTGVIKTLTDYLESFNMRYEVFNDIVGEPSDKMIKAGVKAYKDSQCDFIIGIGGGSPLDSAKAISAMSVLEGEISNYNMGIEIKGRFPPVVLIPTTAGTGSETTKFTIITDPEKEVKMLLKGDALLPKVAIIDPILTKSSPKGLTAATGMDALTHAVEAYTSRKGNTLTDMFALSAIKRIFKYLPIAYNDGNNDKAREEMAIAAFEAGVCINNASVTLVHGMSRPIGALFHVPHGISNAMLIKDCLEFALDGCYEKFADLARAIGASDESTADENAAHVFIQSINNICRECEIPTLAEYGIDKKNFELAIEKMAEDAMLSGSPSNTIKDITKEDIIKIYSRLW